MTSESAYLLKLKSLGWTNARIAHRLGWSEELVQQNLLIAMQEAVHSVENGHAALCEVFSNLCLQYQLVGESLKVVAGAVSELMTVQELEVFWDADPKKTAQKILKGCMPLRNFTPPSSQSIPKESTN